MDSMNKRERLEATVAGEAVDRPAVALWRHFPGDDQRAADLAAAHIWWQQTYDFDLLKITPASSYCTQDWGVEIEWRGGDEGTSAVSQPRHRPARRLAEVAGAGPEPRLAGHGARGSRA